MSGTGALPLLEAAKHARGPPPGGTDVTPALQFVFGADMEFKVVIEEKRDRPEAEFYVCSNYGDYRVETAPRMPGGEGLWMLSLSLCGLLCSMPSQHRWVDLRSWMSRGSMFQKNMPHS